MEKLKAAGGTAKPTTERLGGINAKRIVFAKDGKKHTCVYFNKEGAL